MIEDFQSGEAMPLSGLEVVEVMRRRDLDHAGAEFPVDEGRIADNRNLAGGQGETNRFSDQVAITRVFRMHGDSCVPQHGLGPGRRHGQKSRWIVSQRIMNMIELSLHVLVLDLNIREGSQAARTPINQAFTAVDQPVFIEAHEHFPDRVG